MFGTRVKRAVRELLGARQWPRRGYPALACLEDQVLAALVRPGDVCYDVGANYGTMALLLARLAGEEGLVVAFEPLWGVYRQMCRHVQRDMHEKAPIVCVPAGVGAREGDAVIHVPDGRFGMGSMASAHSWAQAQKATTIGAFSIRVTSVDAFLVSTGLPAPTVLKIDVEGAEFFVLQGAHGLVTTEQRPAMLIEVFAPWERAFGYGPWDVLSWLTERGYRFMFMCPGGLVEHCPSEAKPIPPEYEQGYNVVAYCPAAHGDRVERLRRLMAGGRVLPMSPPPIPNALS